MLNIILQEFTTDLTCGLERGIPRQRKQIREESIKLIISIAKPGTLLNILQLSWFQVIQADRQLPHCGEGKIQ